MKLLNIKLDSRIQEIINEYKYNNLIEGYIVNKVLKGNSVSIEEGSNEGYYINIVLDGTEYSIRNHNYNESLLLLGVMLKLIDSKK